MKRKIVVTDEVKQKLMKQFKASERSLYNALTYDERRGNSPLAMRIREAAMKNGGVSMADDCIDVDTIHLTDGTMKQRHGDDRVSQWFGNYREERKIGEDTTVPWIVRGL